ncbi:MAG: hypothetical protein OEL82_05460 [Nitrosopumilus sp.]|nr:hypothetical protein [Nitrosopumilus sp.]
MIFLLTFANFVLIFHRLLIERIEFLDQVFSELWVFALFFVLIYIPLAILIGAWHRKTQIKIENEVILRQNPLWAKMFRTLIDIELKQISKEELDETRQLLDRIEKGKGQ